MDKLNVRNVGMGKQQNSWGQNTSLIVLVSKIQKYTQSGVKSNRMRIDVKLEILELN